jgi:hypothetical protein
MARARLLVREKTIYDNGDILEVVVWRVPAGPRAPSGVRYRLAFVRHGDPEPAVLYDNHSPKGHHRHIGGVEEPYEFFDVDRLLDDFVTDVRRVTGDDEWPRR